MYLRKAIFLLFFFIDLLANQQLKSNYFISKNYVQLSDIISNPKIDKNLYKINQNRHSKRIKAKELLKTLKELGYNNLYSKHNYIQFTQASPIDVSELKQYIYKYYKDKYNMITIKNIVVRPRSYLEILPKEYKITIGKKAHLKNKGILSLKTINNKKIFFNYSIKAIIPIIKSKNEIKRGDELSRLNTKKESIILDKFRAMPLQDIPNSTLQAKIKINNNKVLTSRDIIGLNLIRRGSNVNVSIFDLNMAVSFMAKAHQNGRYGETILVINKSGKKIKVLVTGKNRAEIK